MGVSEFSNTAGILGTSEPSCDLFCIKLLLPSCTSVYYNQFDQSTIMELVELILVVYEFGPYYDA